MKEIKIFYIAITTFVFSCSPIFAQDVVWFPENAEWYYTPQCIINPACGFLRYYTAGDTVLVGKTAKIINSQFESDESTVSYTESHFFREENDSVFYFSDSTNTWGMLYDFNAQPGDVWDLTETLSGIIFPVWDEEAEVRIEVDSVTTEMLGGMMRRVIHTSPLYNEEEMEPQSDWMFYGSIVEGIGPVGESTGLLGESVVWSPGGYAPHFSCYLENEVLIYGSDELPCGIVSGIYELPPLQLTVFPNPTNSQIRLQLPPKFAFRPDIVVYNAVGQIVSRNENFNNHDLLPMNHPPGLYVVEARSNEQVVRGKVVVE